MKGWSILFLAEQVNFGPGRAWPGVGSCRTGCFRSMQGWSFLLHTVLVGFGSCRAGRFGPCWAGRLGTMQGWSSLAHTELVSLVRKGLVGFWSMENWSILVRAGLVCLGTCRTYRGWSTQGIRFWFRLGCSVLVHSGLVDFGAYKAGHCPCPGRAGRLLSFQVWSAFVPKDQLGKAVRYYFKFPSEKVKNEM